jgi:UDP-glucose:glycoprotein glucosyltransferase
MHLIFICLSYSFYRFVLEPEMNFADNSVKGPVARFDQLPVKPILTLGMDPPESWLVESVYAVYDLDNICMDEVITSDHVLTSFS